MLIKYREGCFTFRRLSEEGFVLIPFHCSNTNAERGVVIVNPIIYWILLPGKQLTPSIFPPFNFLEMLQLGSDYYPQIAMLCPIQGETCPNQAPSIPHYPSDGSTDHPQSGSKSCHEKRKGTQKEVFWNTNFLVMTPSIKKNLLLMWTLLCHHPWHCWAHGNDDISSNTELCGKSQNHEGHSF